MVYFAYYDSPLGKMVMAADETGLTGLWFENQKYFPAGALDRPESILELKNVVEPENVVELGNQLCPEDKWHPGTPDKPDPNAVPKQISEVFQGAACWLDLYFNGGIPGFMPKLHLKGTPFRMAVWEMLLEIPYGQTRTYGELAAEMAAQKGISRMSAQAIGGAVGHNPISIIVPCHRIIGADGSLTGYAGGIERKQALLTIEGAMKDGYYATKKSTAP